jgi:iron complex outermembrane receptor protein
VTNVQNVDRVRTRGVEAAFGLAMPGYDALSFEGSVAYAKARILENDNNPVSVRNIWPRVPDWRATLQALWRPGPQWLASVGARYSGRMYNRLENDDINPDTYGGVSRYMIFDARAAYTTWNRLEIAVGIDNLTDERAYQSHPYPGRTGYVEARWSFGERP